MCVCVELAKLTGRPYSCLIFYRRLLFAPTPTPLGQKQGNHWERRERPGQVQRRRLPPAPPTRSAAQQVRHRLQRRQRCSEQHRGRLTAHWPTRQRPSEEVGKGCRCSSADAARRLWLPACQWLGKNVKPRGGRHCSDAKGVWQSEEDCCWRLAARSH